MSSGSRAASAADQWIEVKSPHFTVLSNSGERSARRLAWQLEQVRSATVALWSWARPDLNKPLRVIAVKDESSMRRLVPEYWETRGTIRPASVWVSGPDRYYLAIRTDIQLESQGTLNPYLTAYESYVSLILRQSVGGRLPLWLSHGFSEVLANTIVTDDGVLIGPPIPYYLQILRERPIVPLSRLLAITADASEYQKSEPRDTVDAEAWAFVHFLMFAENGSRAEALTAFSNRVIRGEDPAAAFAAALGPVDALDLPFKLYVQRSIFTYRKSAADVSVERERFPLRPLAPAEIASARAMFYATMNRPAEARAAMADARKADPQSADSYMAEGLLLDRAGKRDEAGAAYARACELNTSSAYAHYRVAALSWQPNPSKDVVAVMDRHLLKAVELNPRYADAYSWLGELRAFAGDADALGLIARAIALEPAESMHRLRQASALLALRKPDEAEAAAKNALSLATDDAERQEAQRVLAAVARARGANRP